MNKAPIVNKAPMLQTVTPRIDYELYGYSTGEHFAGRADTACLEDPAT